MANYLERQEILDAISNSVEFTKDGELQAATKILNLIKWMPAADVVEVVRCKDCKTKRNEHGYLWCYRWDDQMKPDDYCSYGERKDGEG